MSGLLLDTHAFLWFSTDDHRLPERVREQVRTEPDVYFSVASIWEMAIKTRLGRLRWTDGFEEAVERGIRASNFRLLDVRAPHAVSVASLPRHHGDPFDLLLIAQARG